MASVITPKPGEEVLLTLRKNPNKLGKEIFIGLLILALGILGLVFFMSNSIVSLISLILFGVAFAYGLYHFLVWFYDVYIITNIRIICVNQKSLFSREFIETEISKIQDVTYSIKGVFATLFKYGAVKIHSNTGLEVELMDLSDPDEIQEMIKNLAEATHKNQQKDMTAQELIDFIAKSHKK
jgi:membrane protein YdbS with pleckstrin-like domain